MSSAEHANLPDPGSPDLTGRELGGYSILRRIGSGGMAEVYLAQQHSLDRQVALKVLNPSLASDANYVERFQNEARAAASLVHPNIVQIYEVGQAEGIHFIAQEYVAGKNLGQLLEREGAFQPALVLDILRQVVSALCKAHEFSIVHRDIKPENLLLSNSGEVKVADFGLARVQNTDTKTLTQVGVAMGTPLYMSPEQIEGRPVDARSDIYSLGVSCYHLLSGNPPYTGDTALAIAVQHLHSTPEPLENVRHDLPSALARTVHQMLAKQPDARPASPSDLLVDLRDLATNAAAEGWAESPEHWSLSEWIATDPARSRKSEELSQYMQAEAGLEDGQRNGRRWIFGLAALVLLGGLLGAATRPRFFLAGQRTEAKVPQLDSAWAQVYHAHVAGNETSWIKAIEYPEVDPFVQQLAQRGLVRHYLLVTQEYKKAIPTLRKLGELADPSRGMQQAFGVAGLCICYENLGRKEAALTSQARLDASMREQLQREEPQIYRLLQASLKRLGI